MQSSRRRFTKRFKQSALKKIEAGEAVTKVARKCKVHPTVLYRWQRELKKYGDGAFCGCGSRHANRARRVRAFVLHLSEDEFRRLNQARAMAGARHLSGFVRTRLLTTRSVSLIQLSRTILDLTGALRRLHSHLSKAHLSRKRKRYSG